MLVSNHRNYTKGMGLDRVKILLGKGLMTSEGELWKRQRYMMQPFFHRRVVTEFAQMIEAANDRFIARWEALAARGEPLNVTDEMSELTLDIVLRSIFGRDLQRMSEQLGGNPFEVVTKDQERNLQFAFKFRSLTKLVAGLIERRRAQSEEHFDYVGMLMNARDKETGAPMSDRELIDEIMTLVVAGHETTASGLNWTWYLLSQNPEVEARLHAEIDAAPDMPTPSLEQMEALAYTQQVINEALRLYPPGWLLSRRTIEAGCARRLRYSRRHERAAAALSVAPASAFWKDPDRFWPERFAPEHEAERPRFAYMPFAAGPRHCIGETFALYEMLMHLYKVARRYRLILRTRQAAGARGADQPAHPSPLVHEAGTPLMLKATTLTELFEANRNAAQEHHLSRRRERLARCLLRRAARARARHPVSPAAHRREARRQAHPVPRQQRAVHRRLLGGHPRRHHPGARRARVSATSIATSCCASRASSATHSSTPSASSLDRIGAFADAGGRDRGVRRACARARSSSMIWMTSRGPAKPTKPNRTMSPSSSSRRAPPASPRASCSLTATSSPTAVA